LTFFYKDKLPVRHTVHCTASCAGVDFEGN